MTFWNDRTAAPIQQHHFSVEFGDDWLPYEVKSVTMPQLEISEGQYKMGNHYYKYPGTSRWNDVVITIADTGNAVDRIVKKLMGQGYYHPKTGKGPEGIKKSKRFDNQAVVIRQHVTHTKVATIAEEEEQKGGFLS